MKNSVLFFIALGVLVSVAEARALQPLAVDPAAMPQLEGLASGDCSPEKCFDGQPILRSEGALVILKEEKLNEQYYPGGWQGGVRHGEGSYRPPRMVRTYKQTVGVADRKGFVKESRDSGAFWGGMLGAVIGLAVGVLAAPLGGAAVLAGLGVLAAGVAMGIDEGQKNGARKPKVFDREQSYTEYLKR